MFEQNAAHNSQINMASPDPSPERKPVMFNARPAVLEGSGLKPNKRNAAANSISASVKRRRGTKTGVAQAMNQMPHEEQISGFMSKIKLDNEQME